MGRFAEGKKPLSEAVARARDDFHGAAAFPIGAGIGAVGSQPTQTSQPYSNEHSDQDVM